MSVPYLTKEEQETIVTMNNADKTAHVWTAQVRVINRLRKIADAKLIAEGSHGKTPWAEFELPANLVSFRSSRRMSPEQKANAAERLAELRTPA
jgi:hypothetical protein